MPGRPAPNGSGLALAPGEPTATNQPEPTLDLLTPSRRGDAFKHASRQPPAADPIDRWRSATGVAHAAVMHTMI
jgi:hypothetical protein